MHSSKPISLSLSSFKKKHCNCFSGIDVAAMSCTPLTVAASPTSKPSLNTAKLTVDGVSIISPRGVSVTHAVQLAGIFTPSLSSDIVRLFLSHIKYILILQRGYKMLHPLCFQTELALVSLVMVLYGQHQKLKLKMI